MAATISEFEIKVKVSTTADHAKRISKVLKSLVKNISDSEMETLAKKVEENPEFFKTVAPYLSML